MNFIIIFITLSLVNVILSTIKSIITVKGTKISASLISGFYYGFYNIMIVYTVMDFPLWQKIVITALANIIGVYFVKLFEEKQRKEMLWKIEATFTKENAQKIITSLKSVNIPFNYIEVGKYTIVNMYCETSKQSAIAKQYINYYNGKYFVSESKIL